MILVIKTRTLAMQKSMKLGAWFAIAVGIATALIVAGHG